MKNVISHSKPTLGPAERRAVDGVIRSGLLAQGREVAAFEAETAAYVGVKGGVAVSSGTKAIELCLRAMGVGASHEVLIPSYVCSALWHAVRKVGATPVIVDCDPVTLNMSISHAARLKTKKTKAIVLPHMFGVAADIDAARRLRVAIIEDCAQSLGGTFSDGRRLGSQGDAAIASFYATKLMTTGEGGMVLSNNQKILNQVRTAREYDGCVPSASRVSENAKMTEMQAAMGRVQLKRLGGFLKSRRALAAAYDQALSGLDITLPPNDKGRVYHRYVIRVPKSRLESILKTVHRQGVMAHRPTFRPLHRDAGKAAPCPQSDRAWAECLSLPIYPLLKEAEQKKVVGALARALAR